MNPYLPIGNCYNPPSVLVGLDPLTNLLYRRTQKADVHQIPKHLKLLCLNAQNELIERVFVNLAILHDHREVFSWVC